MIYLDTHAVVYLYNGDLTLFSNRGKKILDEEEILISPIVVLELQFLWEVKKCQVQALDIVNPLAEEIGLKLCPYPFAKIVSQGVRENWTRDPFDRLIVAHARATSALLLSRDERIQQNYPKAFW